MAPALPSLELDKPEALLQWNLQLLSVFLSGQDIEEHGGYRFSWDFPRIS